MPHESAAFFLSLSGAAVVMSAQPVLQDLVVMLTQHGGRQQLPDRGFTHFDGACYQRQISLQGMLPLLNHLTVLYMRVSKYFSQVIDGTARHFRGFKQ